MKKIWFSTALFAAATTAINVPQMSSSAQQETMLAQVDSEQFAQLGLGQATNPIAQAKEAMKELKSGVEQEDAKKMGYAEYNVYKKLRDSLRKKNKKSEEITKKLKIILKNGWDGKKTMDNLAKGASGSDSGSSSSSSDDHSDDEDEKKKEKKDSDKKKSSDKKDKKKKKDK